MVGKTPNVLSATNQPFKTGPLIDQNGQYVRYDILVNEPMFDYIVDNTLYSVAGQTAFTSAVDFPPGFVAPNPPPGAPPKPAPGAFGAIMIKVAWKPLGKNDNPAKFHTMTALVYQPAQVNPKIAESCHKAVLGLVGMHIAHKTKNDPQWLWSTFEHVDNVPTDADVAAKHLQAHYNFFNPACKTCKINDTPPRPWNPNVVPFPGGYHSQITRVIPITKEVIRAEQRVPQPAQGQGVAELHSDQHAMADRRDQHVRPDRQARADLSRQHHGRDLHPGQGAAILVQLHRVPQQRDHDGRPFLRLHLHPGKRALDAAA